MIRTNMFAVLLSLTFACGSRTRRRPEDGGIVARPDAGGLLDARVDGAGEDARAACDEDLDGYESIACGGSDCDDADSFVHPGAPDGEWSSETVPNEPAYEGGDDPVASSLQVDDLGDVHITYPFGPDDDLRYASRRGDVWSIESIDSEVDRVEVSSLALDSSGRPHVTYIGSAGLRYARFDGFEWSIETVPSGVGPIGRHCALALDASDDVHISFPGNGDPFGDEDLVYATNASGAWSLESMAARGDTSDIALERSGTIHVASSDFAGRRLYHTSNATGLWVSEYLADDGVDPSLAIDGDGVPHIVYWTTPEVLHSWWNGAAWETEVVASVEGTGAWTSLRIDASGALHVAFALEGERDYYGPTTGWGLSYATNAAGEWVVEPILDGDPTDPSLAIGPDGAPRVAYYDVSQRRLRYAVRTGADGVDQDCDGADL